MKTTIAIALFTAATSLGFAQEEVSLSEKPENLSQMQIPALKTETVPLSNAESTKSLIYFRLSGAETNAVHGVPGMGLGYRYVAGKSAVDFSASYSRQLSKDHKNKNYFYTIPRIAYLRYLNSNKDASFYYGAGLAWGGVKKQNVQKFTGIIPSLSTGYEWGRLQNWGAFAQLDVSQPALSIREISSIKDLPGPLVEGSVGIGF